MPTWLVVIIALVVIIVGIVLLIRHHLKRYEPTDEEIKDNLAQMLREIREEKKR